MDMNKSERILKMLTKIPRGKVTTYKLISEKLGTKAYRAVGNALRKNPYAPEVPCHRVVNSDGSVGGYKGKLNNKEKIRLLRKEGVGIKNNKIDNLKLYLY